MATHMESMEVLNRLSPCPTIMKVYAPYCSVALSINIMHSYRGETERFHGVWVTRDIASLPICNGIRQTLVKPFPYTTILPRLV